MLLIPEAQDFKVLSPTNVTLEPLAISYAQSGMIPQTMKAVNQTR